MAKTKLMTFAEFEAFITKNEWISNDDFNPDSYPDHVWFRVDAAAVAQKLDADSAKILEAMGPVPKEDVELRHLERNALELRHVMLSPAKKIFFFGSAGE
jgi:hypothetical protein